ncbi:S1C family serine protease [uncultured Friedmanniella sp.]|uniref:S1C family serine protease n=1 Tax=uncultured Friedmanniella sp. TaxID=335381 RepID=UPI0035CA80F4
MDRSGAGRPRGFREQSEAELARPATDVQGPATTPVRVGSAGLGSALGPRPAWRWVLAAAALLGALVLVIAVLAFRLGATSGAATDAASTAPTPTPAATATPLPVPDLYRQVVPSVVLVTTSKGSLGSGTVVTDTGTVLTANHVVSGGGGISIVFADGTRSAATISTRNQKTDTATLTPARLPEVVVAATVGGGVAVGDDVVAIGNPLGLRDSTSAGVVSGLGRTTKTEAGSVSGLIQFDAAVNPGSSGGPLFDAQGLVVGVVVSIADPGKDDAFAGIGFAVPIGSALGAGTGAGPGEGGQL